MHDPTRSALAFVFVLFGCAGDDGGTTVAATSSGSATNVTDSTSATGDTSVSPSTTDGTSTANDTTTTDSASATGGETSPTSEAGTDESTGADGTGSTSGGAAGTCGWDDLEAYYACGLVGAEPTMQVPIDCPDGLVEGQSCGDLGLDVVGCCDANGDNWYCEGEVAVFDDCSR